MLLPVILILAHNFIFYIHLCVEYLPTYTSVILCYTNRGFFLNYAICFLGDEHAHKLLLVNDLIAVVHKTGATQSQTHKEETTYLATPEPCKC